MLLLESLHSYSPSLVVRICSRESLWKEDIPDGEEERNAWYEGLEEVRDVPSR